ncbi:alpha/beta-hydrolase [Russula ochroleuca]|uniref:Alpha/beta-hydrolase n=1 Tax=Russula ochroleuca TaxID=152965 RepID=A0A9P5TC60_9AGAM|nr:alpha/beta-hydrolase [Russula ochroleuca]
MGEALQQQWTSIHDPTTCTRKGLCPVKKVGGQDSPTPSYSLYFEQHGTGPIKVVFIMGLNVSCNAWAHQVKHFGRLPQYSILVFDNRGVGNSDTPRGPYSTSGMAEDVIVLLDFLGWTEKRSLHLVGLSLGGMIAQGALRTSIPHNVDVITLRIELSYRIPERFISLTLAATTAGGFPLCNIPPDAGMIELKSSCRVQFIRDPEKRVPYVVEMCFNASWLDATAKNDAKGRTNREVQTALYNERAALTRVQKPLGAISQMWAGFTHHVQAERLAQISKTIPKVVILTGDEDHLIRPANSAYLKKHMAEAEYIVWKDTGHVVNMQHVERFNALLEGVFQEGQARMEGRI